MKYAVVLLNAIGVLVLGWAFFVLTRSVAPPLKAPLPVPATADANSDKEREAAQHTLAAIEKLGREMTSASNKDAGTLIALPSATGGVIGRPELPQRELTLLLEAQGDRRAVIDGRLVRAGDRLPAGGRVLRLRTSQVTLAEKQGRQTLDMPVAQIRVGSVLRRATKSDVENATPVGTVTAGTPSADNAAALATALNAVQAKR